MRDGAPIQAAVAAARTAFASAAIPITALRTQRCLRRGAAHHGDVFRPRMAGIGVSPGVAIVAVATSVATAE